MTEIQNKCLKAKQYDLEDRTLRFSQKVIEYCNKLTKTMANIEIIRQLIRSSGSVGANYIEANESLSKKDFVLRVKICRKEAKESRYWLILSTPIDSEKKQKQSLILETNELMKIFGAILEKCK